MATNNMLNVPLSGSTGTVNFVGSTSPTLVTPILGAATATSIVFSPTTSGIIGTTTNDDATTGKVGEFVTATASTVSVTTATTKTITSISLTAGDWDVWGNMIFTSAASTIPTTLSAGVSSTNNTVEVNSSYFQLSVPVATGSASAIPLAPTRKSLSGTTTIYLIANAVFTVSTMTCTGVINARRMR